MGISSIYLFILHDPLIIGCVMSSFMASYGPIKVLDLLNLYLAAAPGKFQFAVPKTLIQMNKAEQKRSRSSKNKIRNDSRDSVTCCKN